jgi:hypothetical protein
MMFIKLNPVSISRLFATSYLVRSLILKISFVRDGRVLLDGANL